MNRCVVGLLKLIAGVIEVGERGEEIGAVELASHGLLQIGEHSAGSPPNRASNSPVSHAGTGSRGRALRAAARAFCNGAGWSNCRTNSPGCEQFRLVVLVRRTELSSQGHQLLEGGGHLLKLFLQFRVGRRTAFTDRLRFRFLEGRQEIVLRLRVAG